MFGLEQPDQKSLLPFVAWFLLSTLGKAIASLSSTDIAKPGSQGGTNFFCCCLKIRGKMPPILLFLLQASFKKIFSILWFSKVSSGEKGCEFINGLNYFNTTSLPKEDGHTFFPVPAVGLGCTKNWFTAGSVSRTSSPTRYRSTKDRETTRSWGGQNYPLYQQPGLKKALLTVEFQGRRSTSDVCLVKVPKSVRVEHKGLVRNDHEEYADKSSCSTWKIKSIRKWLPQSLHCFQR